MQLFCSKCEKDASENVTVYENVDGFLIHCGECNHPIMFLDYGEPNMLADIKANAEEQMDLFKSESSCDCSRCSEAAPEEDEEVPNAKLIFTNEDLNIMERTLIGKTKSLRKSLDKTWETLEKIQTLQGLRAC